MSQPPNYGPQGPRPESPPPGYGPGAQGAPSKPWWKKKWGIALIVFLVVGLLGSLTGGDEDEEPVALASETEPDVTVSTDATAERTEALPPSTPSAPTPVATIPAGTEAECLDPPEEVQQAIQARLRDPSLTVQPYAYLDTVSLTDPPVYMVAANVLRPDGERESSAELWAVSSLRADAMVYRLFGDELSDAPDYRDVGADDPRYVYEDGSAGTFMLDCFSSS